MLNEEGLNSWLVDDSGEEIHCYPIYDVKPHIAHVLCWCNPEADRSEGNAFIHNRKLDEKN